MHTTIVCCCHNRFEWHAKIHTFIAIWFEFNSKAYEKWNRKSEATSKGKLQNEFLCTSQFLNCSVRGQREIESIHCYIFTVKLVIFRCVNYRKTHLRSQWHARNEPHWRILWHVPKLWKIESNFWNRNWSIRIYYNFLQNVFFYTFKGAFEDPDVTHVEGEVNPVRDLDIIAEELRLKDEETLNKCLDKLERTVVRGNDKKLKPEFVSREILLNFIQNPRRTFSTWVTSVHCSVRHIICYRWFMKKLFMFLCKFDSHSIMLEMLNYYFHEWIQSIDDPATETTQSANNLVLFYIS